MRSNPEVSAQRSFTENARRAQIIEAAIGVLASAGFAATSLAAIAEQLRISKGVISYHFAGKAELLGEVVTAILDEAGEWMRVRVEHSPNFAAGLAAYIRSNLEYIGSHQDAVSALTEVLSNARATPAIEQHYQKSQNDAVAALQAIFEGGEMAGEFAPILARTAAIALRAAIDAATVRLRSEPTFDVTAYADGLIEIYSRAVKR